MKFLMNAKAGETVEQAARRAIEAVRKNPMHSAVEMVHNNKHVLVVEDDTVDEVFQRWCETNERI